VGATSYVNINYLNFRSIILGLGSEYEHGMTLSPNPFTNESLIIGKEGTFNYQISDMKGVLVEKGQGENQQAVGTHLAPGIYLLSVKSESGVLVQKIIKQ
jgi:hypothetical protein